MKQENRPSDGRKAAFLCLLLLFCMALSGCEANTVAPIERLYDVKDAISLPHGIYYNSRAEKWEEGYIAPETAESLYRFNGYSELHHAEEYAVFLSDRFGSVYEIGIFRARDRVTADELVSMSYRRIALLQRYASNKNDGCVAVFGSNVIYVYGFDEAAQKQILRAAFR